LPYLCSINLCCKADEKGEFAIENAALWVCF